MKKVFLLILIISTSIFSNETYFGKNKLQYKNFNWFYIQSNHFDIYFNDGGYDIAVFSSEKLENALTSISKTFKYKITNRIPVILYNSHNDFQQTNVISSYLEEGIGGVTELFKNRVVLPFEGDYKKFQHVIHHELVHAVINDMFYGGSLQNIISGRITLQLPLWFNEGLAEYEALKWDVNSDMFIRDAALNEYLPDIENLSGYFAYRGGQSVWWYIANRYGEEKISEILHNVKNLKSVEGGFNYSLGFGLEEFSKRWKEGIKKKFFPDIKTFETVKDFSTQITNHKEEECFYNTSPTISPKGDKIVFISDRENYFDVYLYSTVDKKVKKIIESQRTSNFEELHLLTPGITFSPNGKKIAIAVKSGGSDAIVIFNIETEEEQTIVLPLNGIYSVDWSTIDENKIAFVGINEKQSDIFLYDIKSLKLENLTNDISSDSDPSWSKDGKKIYFSSDRNSDTKFQFDIYSCEIENKIVSQHTNFPESDETSPIASKNGEEILFLSDANGINNIYKTNFKTGNTFPITNSISGIYQLSISQDEKKLVFSSLLDAGFDIFLLTNPFEMNAISEIPKTDFKKNLSENISTISLEENVEENYAYDFSKHIFGIDSKPTETKDLIFIVKDNLDSNGNFIANRYKLKFSPDIVTGTVAYNTLYGAQGSTFMAFSDMLGNHQIYLQTNLVVNDLKDGDYSLTYLYLPKRTDFAFQVFHSSRLLYLENDGYFLPSTRFRSFGANFSMLYPIGKFKRIDFGAYFVRSVRENLTESKKNSHSDILFPSLSFVHDNTLWGHISPIAGSRYNFSIYGVPKIDGSRSFISSTVDFRKYFRISRNYSFLSRIFLGGSFGETPQKFLIGGVDNWLIPKFGEIDSTTFENPEDVIFLTTATPLRGFKYYEKVGEKFAITNFEIRYPFIGFIAVGPLPVFFQSLMGTAFLDIGGTWNKEKHFRGIEKINGKIVTKDLLIGTGTGVRIFVFGFLLKFDVAWSYNIKNFSNPEYYISLGEDL